MHKQSDFVCWHSVIEKRQLLIDIDSSGAEVGEAVSVSFVFHRAANPMNTSGISAIHRQSDNLYQSQVSMKRSVKKKYLDHDAFRR